MENLSSAFRLLPSAFCLLPSAYCLLPTACCLLPSPSAFDTVNGRTSYSTVAL